MGKRGPTQVERAVQVDREIVGPFVVGHRLGAAHLMASRDVDEHVEPTELFDTALDRIAARRRRSHAHRRVGTRFHIGEHGSQPVGVPGYTENRCTFAGKQPRGFGAQPRRGAGDENDFAVQR
jgi:hypothetical protein